MKILYLDDDAINRLVVAKTVNEKYEIDAVEKASEAIALGEKNKYDILLIDINLNDHSIDGFGVLKKLKTFPHLEDAIYIAHTNYFGDEWELRCINNGFDSYLSKPFVLSEFEKLVVK